MRSVPKWGERTARRHTLGLSVMNGVVWEKEGRETLSDLSARDKVVLGHGARLLLLRTDQHDKCCGASAQPVSTLY